MDSGYEFNHNKNTVNRCQEGAAHQHEPELSPWLRGTDICMQSITEEMEGCKPRRSGNHVASNPVCLKAREKGNRSCSWLCVTSTHLCPPPWGEWEDVVRSYAWFFATGLYGHVHLITLEEKQKELKCVSSSLLCCEWPQTNSTILKRKGGKKRRKEKEFFPEVHLQDSWQAKAVLLMLSRLGIW